MTRNNLIQEIYDRTPTSFKGLNKRGNHMVYLYQSRPAIYATLEKLDAICLKQLAASVGAYNLNLAEELTD